MSEAEKSVSKEEKFVHFVLDRIHKDNGFRAKLSRAVSDSTEYQSWEILSTWCDLDKEWQRLPYAIIGASLAKARSVKDGHLGIGEAIANCYPEGNQSDQAKAKLRRLLACKNTVEACRILRPLLNLVESKGVKVKYSQLLHDLLGYSVDWTPANWAQNFYGKKHTEEGVQE